MLESGEYFGESGVLTYFNGGSKASSTASLVTEQYSLVARTTVEMLVLRRKHFNIIEIPVRLFFKGKGFRCTRHVSVPLMLEAGSLG